MIVFENMSELMTIREASENICLPRRAESIPIHGRMSICREPEIRIVPAGATIAIIEWMDMDSIDCPCKYILLSIVRTSEELIEEGIDEMCWGKGIRSSLCWDRTLESCNDSQIRIMKEVKMGTKQTQSTRN